MHAPTVGCQKSSDPCTARTNLRRSTRSWASDLATVSVARCPSARHVPGGVFRAYPPLWNPIRPRKRRGTLRVPRYSLSGPQVKCCYSQPPFATLSVPGQADIRAVRKPSTGLWPGALRGRGPSVVAEFLKENAKPRVRPLSATCCTTAACIALFDKHALRCTPYAPLVSSACLR